MVRYAVANTPYFCTLFNSHSLIEDTLWLRAMGKGKTQTEAISKVVEPLPASEEGAIIFLIFIINQNLVVKYDYSIARIHPLVATFSRLHNCHWQR